MNESKKYRLRPGKFHYATDADGVVYQCAPGEIVELNDAQYAANMDRFDPTDGRPGQPELSPPPTGAAAPSRQVQPISEPVVVAEDADVLMVDTSGMNAKQIVALVSASDDGEAVAAIGDAENERDKPRKTVLEAVEKKLDALTA